MINQPLSILSSHEPQKDFERDNRQTKPSCCMAFTLFNQLPTELRHQIWEAALPGPRIIQIKEKLVRKTKDEDEILSLLSNSKAPPMLYVCRDSQRVAQKFYVPSFTFADSDPKIYFDFSADTLYLLFDEYTLAHDDDFESEDSDDSLLINVDVRFENFLDALHDVADLCRVQKLALLLSWEDANCHQQLAQVLGWFGHIRELIIVVGHFSQGLDDQGDILFYEPLDITETCYNYKTFPREVSYERTPDVPLVVNFVSTVDLKKELKNLQVYERGGRGTIPMPHIAYRSAVTHGLERHLDGLQKEYQKNLINGRNKTTCTNV